MILVTGATGTVGRPLVELLHTAGARVRALTRDSAAAGLPSGVDVVEAGAADALDGVAALFLHPRAVRDAAELMTLARKRGVRRVVALAAMNVDDDITEQPSRYSGDRNKETEDAAVTSGLEWTSLRPGSFAANTIGMFGAQLRFGDVVRYAYPRFAESPIHEQDIAEVAAQALLTDELVGRKLALTGPESLTHEEMVAVIGQVTGRRLRYEELEPADVTRQMVAHGLPEPFVTALMARYAKHLDAPQYPPTGEVDKVLGRPARTYAEWVADHATAFQS